MNGYGRGGKSSFVPWLLDIKIYVRIVIGRYKKFQIVLIHGGDRFIRGFYSPKHRRLDRSVREDVKFVTYRRDLRGGHDVTEEN